MKTSAYIASLAVAAAIAAPAAAPVAHAQIGIGAGVDVSAEAQLVQPRPTVNANASLMATTSVKSPMGGDRAYKPAIVGTVTAVSGSTITVAAKGSGSSSATTTYSVDASAAAVVKGGATTTLSKISVGDTVVIEGTINGSAVTATSIRDGKINLEGRNSADFEARHDATSSESEGRAEARGSIFARIGLFFSSLFGGKK